jgi:hypothetical protein
MRTVSQNDLALLKRRKGVVVKRKFGAQKLETKKPKSVVSDSMPLSGSKSSELPTSALLKNMVINNTKMIQHFQKSIEIIKKTLNKEEPPRPIELWMHEVKRNDETGLMSSVISSTKSRSFIHRIHRNNKGVIDSITTKNK